MKRIWLYEDMKKSILEVKRIRFNGNNQWSLEKEAKLKEEEREETIIKELP